MADVREDEGVGVTAGVAAQSQEARERQIAQEAYARGDSMGAQYTSDAQFRLSALSLAASLHQSSGNTNCAAVLETAAALSAFITSGATTKETVQ